MDSDIIVIDDAPVPARSRQRKPRKVKEQPIVLDSDSAEDSDTQKQQKRQKAAQKRKRKSQDSDAAVAEKMPSKQQRKQKQKKQPEEKRTDAAGRTVRFAAQPSQAIYTRIQRALPGSAHRMFLISTKELTPAGAEGGRSQEFTVLGATGNVYTVAVSRHPHCSCPDHARGNLCKHILFVMLRVLKLATNNPLVWQKALLTKEVEDVLSGAHSQGSDMSGVLADERVRQAYDAAAGGSAAAAAGDGGGGSSRRKPVEGDCPICFEELKDSGEALVWCEEGCGNNMHKKCFDVWAATKRSNAATITCVYCRAPWKGAAPAAATAGTGGGEYLNLAQHSTAHRAGSTSMQSLYGDENAMWINYHQSGRALGGAARMYTGGYGGGRRFYRR